MARDVRWIAEIAEGNQNAFEQLCRQYEARIFGFLFRKLGDREAAEEVMNDVLLGIWKSAAKFRGDSRPLVWIFGIANNKALARFSRRRRRQSFIANTEELPEVADQGIGPEETLINSELVKWALERLSPEHREAMELTYFSGFSYPEISKSLGIPEATVKTRMFYARKRLRDIMKGSEAGSESR